MERLKERYGIEMTAGRPRVPYRETIKGASKSQGKYKKQTGGRGQYGDVWLEVRPLKQGQGYEFINKIFGGAIPAKYVPSAEKGVKEAMKKGVLAGYPVTDISVTICDGSYHEVDSSDIAFQIAGSMALKKAFTEARPILLEPIVNVEVIAPDQYLGDITGDLNSRRGRILGMEAAEDMQVIKAQVPLAEMYRYSTDLRSQTHGAGTYTMSFSHYEEVPPIISKKIIEEATKTQKAEEAEK
jgi:elongation factor G